MAERVFTQTFAVVGAIIEKDGKILLVKENDPITEEVGKWNQPAGWLDVGEDSIDMVKREIKEETGLDFEPTGLLGVYSLVRKDREKALGVFPHAIKLIFRGRFAGDLITSNEEIAETRWFTPEEIDAMDMTTLRDLDIKQEVRDYFAGKNYPLDIIRHTVQK